MKKIIHFVKKQPKKNIRIASLAAVVVIGALSFYSFHKAKAVTRPIRVKGEQVSVASVNSLSPNNIALSVIGKVESENDATILSETSGEIVSLNHELGDHVYAGDVIATIENSSQQAAVAQAQGAYDAAEANLAKASGTTAENSMVSSNQANQTTQNAQASAVASLQTTYAALNDAVYIKTDELFNNPNSTIPTVIPIFISSSPVVINLQNERLQIGTLLAAANAVTSSTTSDNLDANITTMVTTAQTVENFLNNLVTMINDNTLLLPNQNVSSTTISGYQTLISSARTEVVNAVANLTTTKTTYDSDVLNATSATNSAYTGTQSDIAIAQANTQTALGALESAKATLDKTIIRSPISGTIINLPITNGDYVASFSQVAEVSNPSALKVVAYVTGSDAQTLSVGNKVTVGDTATGVITQIAPAINPQTGTIEVDIGLNGDESSLVDGDSVTVSLDRSVAASSVSSNNGSIIIPIVSLKITPDGPVVFLVDGTTKTLVSHPVSIGSILGENIVVTKGLTSDMIIVTDARGLTDGENVSVKQ